MPVMRESVAGGSGRGIRPSVLVWLFLATVTTLPYLLAALAPPPGRTFVGTFHWVDDFHNYVSFVQQSEDGRFLFDNKLVPAEQPRVLVNLEWWMVGKLSRLLGRRPFLAYRLFSIVVLGALVVAVGHALRRAGLPTSHATPALLLVLVGGGFGGFLFEWTSLPVARCVDLSVGLFPFLAALANPHWLFSTMLLLCAFMAYGRIRGPRDLGVAVFLGLTLCLVRPYDFVILGVVQGVFVLATYSPRNWLRELVPLILLLPGCGYLFWVFFGIDSFRDYASSAYSLPSVSDFAMALAPALLLAMLSVRGAPPDEAARRFRLQLWLWVALAALMLVVRPVTFSSQFAVGMGLPLLMLGALGLARWPPWVTAGAALVLSSASVIAVKIVLTPEPFWFPPSSRREAAVAQRATCGSDSISFSPADIGLYTIALTSCKAYVSHPWLSGAMPPYLDERMATVRAFYGPLATEQRSAILDKAGVTHLILPGNPGIVPQAWLGADTRFRSIAVVGAGEGTISVYARSP